MSAQVNNRKTCILKSHVAASRKARASKYTCPGRVRCTRRLAIDTCTAHILIEVKHTKRPLERYPVAAVFLCSSFPFPAWRPLVGSVSVVKGSHLAPSRQPRGTSVSATLCGQTIDADEHELQPASICGCTASPQRSRTRALGSEVTVHHLDHMYALRREDYPQLVEDYALSGTELVPFPLGCYAAVRTIRPPQSIRSLSTRPMLLWRLLVGRG